MPQLAYLPVADGPCIRCKVRKPGGTPFLCLLCLRAVTKLMLLRHDYYQGLPEEQLDYFVRARAREHQKAARSAFRRLQAGLLPLTPPGF